MFIKTGQKGKMAGDELGQPGSGQTAEGLTGPLDFSSTNGDTGMGALELTGEGVFCIYVCMYVCVCMYVFEGQS